MDFPALQILNEVEKRSQWLDRLGVKNRERAEVNLKAIAKSGMTLDLVAELFRQLELHMPGLSDQDMALNNLERFVLSARSSLALGALFERDKTALPVLLTIFSTSQYLADLLIRDRESYDALRLSEGQPYVRDMLVRDLRGLVSSAKDASAAMTLIRRFKHRETLRIAFGDMVMGQRIPEVTEQISFLAEAACEAAFEFCFRQLAKKWGMPRLADGSLCGYCILAMGKLGGRELNYSSDIDLVMLFEADGECDGTRSRSNREFYDQLTREFSKLLNETTNLGVAYRVDLRLRPEGSKGRICNSFEQMARYYEAKGRTWERQALIKLRPVAGQLELGQRLIDRLKSWIYHRRLNRLDISEIKALKRKIERRALVGGVDRLDLKTGHGGIRDIEFAIQFLQLSYGSYLASVREVNTLFAIEQLQIAGCLTLEEESLLSQNYIWLRKLEHRLQIMFDLQTHTLPEEPSELLKIALRMGYQDYFGKTSLEQFEEDLSEVTEANRRILDHLLHDAFSHDGLDDAEEVPIEADLVLDEDPDPETVANVFSLHRFADPEKAYRNFRNLAVESTRFLSPHRCRHFLAAISAALLEEVSKTPDPDSTLTSLASVSEKIGAKGVLWELFHNHPKFLELYVRMCACGDYLTGVLRSNPGMVDELVDSLALESLPSLEWLKGHMEDLVQGAEDIDPIVHSFKQAQHLRVGIRDILGRDPIREKHRALSDIAEVCLKTVINHEYQSLVKKFGLPVAESQRESELVVLALGKLGGREPNYHSDLDVIFLYDGDGQTQHKLSERQTSNQHFFSELAAKVTKTVTYNGPMGRLYEMDSRLRPTGKSGTLALSFQEFERYYASGKGQFWERLALGKARVIYGALHAAERAKQLVEQALSAAGWTDDLFRDVYEMRLRMQEGSQAANLKRGVGGTVDVEFIVQALQLKHGPSMPSVRVQGTLEALDLLVSSGVLPKADGNDLSRCYQLLRQVESGLRLMNRTARHDLPTTELELRKLAFLLGFDDWQQLEKEVALARKQNRLIFERLVKTR